jgi:hypothetical protein
MRSAHAIVANLTAAGYVVKHKHGRRNRYQIQAQLPLPEPASQEPAIGDVVALGDGARRNFGCLRLVTSMPTSTMVTSTSVGESRGSATGPDCHGPGGVAHRIQPAPQASPLTVILLGSRLKRREDGATSHGALGCLDGSEPVTGRSGVWHRRQSAVRRRCKGGAATLSR